MAGPSNRRFVETPIGAGQGIREENVLQEDGMRCRGVHIGGASTFAQISGTSPTFGGVAGAAVTTWTSLRAAAGSSWVGRAIAPMTPSAFIVTINAGAQVKFRARGYDQFGNHIMEVTSWVVLTAGAGNAVHLLHFSKVFAYVEDVEYQSIAVDIAISTIGIGNSFIIDPDRIENATLADAGNGPVLTYNTTENWGIGTPVRVSPFSNLTPILEQEVLGAGIINANDDADRSVLLPYQAGRSIGVFSSAGYRLGRSLSGWQGTSHKIGFHSDDWATDKLPVETGGSSTLAGDTPTVTGEVGLDFLRLFFWVCSSLGTRRDPMDDRIYIA